MECHGRRNRRGRCRSRPDRPPPVHFYSPPQSSKPWSFLSGVYSLLIMSSLIAVLYMMLEYHCETCRTHYDMNEMNKNIDNIAKNLSVIIHNYYDLETQISRLSQDLPKIERQMEILEALTNSLENKNVASIPFNIPNIGNIFTHDMELEANASTKDIPEFVPARTEVGTD